LTPGPIALIEPGKPVIAVACKDGYEEKIKSNLQEVLTRGGEVYVFADEQLDMSDMGEHCHVISLPPVSSILAPLLYAIPLQLLSYFVAVQKGTDVDQPRNLATSVTVNQRGGFVSVKELHRMGVLVTPFSIVLAHGKYYRACSTRHSRIVIFKKKKPRSMARPIK